MDKFTREQPTRVSDKEVGDIVVPRYANLFLDFTFKRAFGDESRKKFIISLLNAILPEKRIEDVTFNVTEKVGETAKTKRFVLDLLCTSEDQTQFIVEMQNSEHENFFQRCLAYASRIYAERAQRGEEYNRYLPVYIIALMSEEVTKKGLMHEPQYNDKVVYHYHFAEKDTQEVPLEGISIIFVELEKFTKEEKDCLSMKDWWFYIIKNSETMLTPPSGEIYEGFGEFFELLEISKFTPMENRAYIHEYFAEQDRINALRTAENRGKREGREESKIETARKMKAKGFDIETIVDCTDLTKEQVEAL